MQDAPDNPDFPQLRKAIDSTTMLVLARFLMPAVVAVIGYFITITLDDLKQANLRTLVQIAKVTDAQATTAIVTGALTVKVDGAVKQLDHLQAQVDSIARR